MQLPASLELHVLKLPLSPAACGADSPVPEQGQPASRAAHPGVGGIQIQ